ncbi:M6 family metalloprotease domain-containing protein [Fodinibius sediminis]|uniref:Immune inhibitor A n=1 Tax=Fodinibius sediminis TaxID=1214077 RepID=A0A521CGB1_9BACT|nr:M6 family metalloprotease domain-containing protein [Fodinibius sediminis]SMO58474.1 immune inhibitor A [Fodinibius sediminis]
MCNIQCICPPSPELYNQIVRAKKRMAEGADPVAATEGSDSLDARSLSLILSRPNKTRGHTLVAPTRSAAPVTGTRRVLVLLVDFSDEAAGESQSHYNDLLFSVGSHPTGSMRDFYREASYGALDVVGTVSGDGEVTAGWYRAPNPKSYYTNGNYGFDAYPNNAQRLVEDIIDRADPHVDFAQFDNDNDGVVDALVVIAAGSGAEATGDVNDIWSHKWGISPKMVDGVKVQNYFMAPEDGRVGVMAHELGHLLMKWPDLYDTDYSSAGTGSWDLMAGGSWNNGGRSPAHPTAWCKAQAGWITPTTISNAQQNVTLKPYTNNPQVYKLPVGNTGSKEYFLVSNRQQSGFDSHLPGEGMIIEHVDENQSNNTDENHYLVDIEQCDGQRDLNKNANRGDADDAFPCSSNTEFSGTSTPVSDAYDGTESKISVKNIARSGDNVTATITVGAAKVWHYNKAVKMTYTHHTSQWAWAYIDTVGWRRIKDNSPDGVTNLFNLCCEAQANGRNVHVHADEQFLYTMYLT